MLNKDKIDNNQQLGQYLMQPVQEMRAEKISRVRHIMLTPAAKARQKAGLSQAEFANLLGISKRTLQGWEQGRRKPTGPAEILIKIAYHYPEIFTNIHNDNPLPAIS